MELKEKESLDLSIIMPCLNEENTVGICVDDAWAFIKEYNINGEVIVVDNNSTDKSALIAKKHKTRVVKEMNQGYGSAIQAGICASKGKVLIIGDCDTTYDFTNLEGVYYLLQNQCDMIIGNRYAGNIDKGAMSLSHRIGAWILSWIGRRCFHTDVYDFHCGLRGLTREAASKLQFVQNGMEFATEMIAKASEEKMCIKQIPVDLRKCKYKRSSKLHTIRDGWRHLSYMMNNIHKK